MIFSTGTVMLAKKTRSAIGHIPTTIMALTPLIMVSGSVCPSEVNFMTG